MYLAVAAGGKSRFNFVDGAVGEEFYFVHPFVFHKARVLDEELWINEDICPFIVEDSHFGGFGFGYLSPDLHT